MVLRDLKYLELPRTCAMPLSISGDAGGEFLAERAYRQVSEGRCAALPVAHLSPPQLTGVEHVSTDCGTCLGCRVYGSTFDVDGCLVMYSMPEC